MSYKVPVPNGNHLRNKLPVPNLGRLLVLSLCLGAGLSFASADEVSIGAVDASVACAGRFLQEGDSLVLSFPGTEVRVRFRGSAIAMHGAVTSGEGWFNLRVDDAPKPRIDLVGGPFDRILAEGLDPEAGHEIRLVRRNEAWQGVLRLDAFALPEGGEFLEAPEPRARRIMCLGDSITCGQGTEFLPPYAPAGNSTANAELTYGWQLAKAFDADVHVVSYGGKGVIRTWEGNTDEVKAIELFERSHSDLVEPAWDHACYQPDLVTICFGTNDYATGFVDHDTYLAAYLKLVDRVHEVHPQAKILLLGSPMLAGYAPDKAADLAAILREVEAAVQKRGGQYVRVYIFGDYAGTDWDSHPTGPQHAAMAAELLPLVREWLDW